MSRPDYQHPPRMGEWFLKKLYPEQGSYTSLGDFGEVYNRILQDRGWLRAHVWYLSQIMKAIPTRIRNRTYWRSIMFSNYLKIAIRQIQRRKGHSFINIFGLSVGIACCLLIALWVLDELSYDRFHTDADQIYQTLTHGATKNNQSSPNPFAPVFKATYPEVIYASRFAGFDDALIQHGEMQSYEHGIQAVDPDFFKIFTFPFSEGDPNTALDEIHSIVISQSIAKKYFGTENPLSQTLILNRNQSFTVTGVFEDVPTNSTIDFDILLSFEYMRQRMPAQGIDPNSWGSWNPRTFLKLQKNVSVDRFNEKIKHFLSLHDKEEDAVLTIFPFIERNFLFWDTQRYIMIYSVIGVFVLLMACINFTNLSTARAAHRGVEIGIRKVTGAHRKNLILQFLGESLVMVVIALAFAMILAIGFLPAVNSITGKTLTMGSMLKKDLLSILALVLLFTSLVAGGYPAFFLSSFQPVKVLKSDRVTGISRSLLRRVLVFLQFAISIFLIVGTGVVGKQLSFMREKDTGYIHHGLVTIPMEGSSKQSYQTLKNRLLQDKHVVAVTAMGDNLPFFGWSTGTAEWTGKDPNTEIGVYFNTVTYDFVRTLNLRLKEGRAFSEEFPSDLRNGVIANETLVRLMGSESGVGQQITNWGQTFTIIGVVKDAHFEPLTRQIRPRFFLLDLDRTFNMAVRIESDNVQDGIAAIQSIWEEIVPQFPFQYRFVSDRYNRSYWALERMEQMTNGFSFLAILIACMGLLGLASFVVAQRSKEIGIRRVFGSSDANIVFLLSKDFLLNVLMANTVAWPLAFWASRFWLQGFAYRTNIGINPFLFSAALTLCITLFTVGIQAIRAARSNPIEALKYE